MPAAYLMSWEPRQSLWRKMYKGKRYVVSCAQLTQWSGESVPATKEGSYRMANVWWTARKAEIDALQPPHPHADYLAHLARNHAWAVQNGETNDAAIIMAEIKRINAGLEPLYLQALHEKSKHSFITVDDPYIERGHPLEPYDDVWHDRVTRHAASPIPQDRTIGAQADKYVAVELTRVNGGLIQKSEFDTVRRCVYAFRDWAGPDRPIESIDADLIESYWAFLLGWDRSYENKKKRLRVARSFVGWLAGKGLIPLPPNLHNGKFRFPGGSKSVETMPKEDVRRLIENAPGQFRLHFLLMANCGFYQIDISDLKHSDVDWGRGRIIRKRSKTESHDSVPTVEYPLWPPTWELLREYSRPRTDPRVLMTDDGHFWFEDGLQPDGKYRKSDRIYNKFKSLRRKLKITKSLKFIRKTSATLLGSHPDHRWYVHHFLGHAPDSMADRHYVKPDQDRFDDAVRWLGQQYGYA